MSRKLVIDPVTRIEGHGKVTVNLDDDGNVVDARLHVVEFRGFEKFVQGHPFWEAPMLLQRICGMPQHCLVPALPTVCRRKHGMV